MKAIGLVVAVLLWTSAPAFGQDAARLIAAVSQNASQRRNVGSRRRGGSWRERTGDSVSGVAGGEPGTSGDHRRSEPAGSAVRRQHTLDVRGCGETILEDCGRRNRVVRVST